MRSGRHFRAADDSDPEVAALLCSLIGSTAAWGLDTDAYQQLCRQVLERERLEVPRMRLLYLLRFERVDNLGAYSIPSETGLLPRKPLVEVVG